MPVSVTVQPGKYMRITGIVTKQRVQIPFVTTYTFYGTTTTKTLNGYQTIDYSTGITAIPEDVTTTVPGTSGVAPSIKLVNIDSQNPCVVNKESCTAGYSQTSTQAPSNFAWNYIPTIANAVDCDYGTSGYYWATDTNGNVEFYSGSSWKNPTYSTRFKSKALRISVDRRQNIPWIVTDQGDIYALENNYWIQKAIGQKANDIGVGADGSVWITSQTATGGGYTILLYSRSTDSFSNPSGGGAVFIAVAPSGRPWVTNSDGTVFYLNSAGTWVNVAGGFSDLSIGTDGVVWALGSANVDSNGKYIYRYQGPN